MNTTTKPTVTELKQNLHCAVAALESARDRRLFLGELWTKACEMARKDRWLALRDVYDRNLMADDWIKASALFHEFNRCYSEFACRPYYRGEEDDIYKAASLYAELQWAASEYNLD